MVKQYNIYCQSVQQIITVKFGWFKQTIVHTKKNENLEVTASTI